MHMLEDLTMKLEYYPPNWQLDEWEPSVIPPGEKTEFPSIRRLRIQTAFERGSDTYSLNLLGTLFSSLSFPGTTDLHVRLCGRLIVFDSDEDLKAAELLLNNEVRHIFCDVEQFPRVERFRLETTSNSHIIIDFPFNVLPSVKHFAFYSKEHLSNGFWECAGFSGGGDPVPALRTLTLETPSSSDVLSWARDVLLMQIERGEWEEFRELVVSGREGR